MTAPAGYEALQAVLDAAMDQAANGKGRERHGGETAIQRMAGTAGGGEPFNAQPMVTIGRMVGLAFPLGQACKKAQEAARMAAAGQPARARAELLGAINYLAGAVILLDEMPPGTGAAPIGGDNAGAVSSLKLPGRGEGPVPGAFSEGGEC